MIKCSASSCEREDEVMDTPNQKNEWTERTFLLVNIFHHRLMYGNQRSVTEHVVLEDPCTAIKIAAKDLRPFVSKIDTSVCNTTIAVTVIYNICR